MQKLDLADVYVNVPRGRYMYHLRSMVGYYGQHYMAFALMTDGAWHLCDDARITQIGQWPDVVKKCTLGQNPGIRNILSQGLVCMVSEYWLLRKNRCM